MKGFIEIKEQQKGTKLISISNIFSIRPLLGTLHSTTEIMLMPNNGDNKEIKCIAEETYDKVKALIEAAQ